MQIVDSSKEEEENEVDFCKSFQIHRGNLELIEKGFLSYSYLHELLLCIFIPAAAAMINAKRLATWVASSSVYVMCSSPRRPIKDAVLGGKRQNLINDRAMKQSNSNTSNTNTNTNSTGWFLRFE